MATAARRLQSAWRRLSRLPGGPWLFDRLLRRMVPYSGTIHPRVLSLEPGRAVVRLEESRRLRNHLHSIHAIALANLGELASGLAMTLALPRDVRGIPVRIQIAYLKKARGAITATGRASPPARVKEDVESAATAEMRDQAGEVVARIRVHWRLSPAP